MSMSHEEYNRLRWQCRRGMLELDLLLLRFLDQNFTLMSPQELGTFKRLLAETDVTLIDWFIYGKRPKQLEFFTLIQKIMLNK